MRIKYWFYARAMLLLDVNILQTPVAHFYQNIKKTLDETFLVKDLDVIKHNKNAILVKVDAYYTDAGIDQDVRGTIEDTLRAVLEDYSPDVKNASTDVISLLKSQIIIEEPK